MQILHAERGFRVTPWAGFGTAEWEIGRKSPTREYGA